MQRKVKNLYIVTSGLKWQPKELPLSIVVESKAVLKELPKAHKAIAGNSGVTEHRSPEWIDHSFLIVRTRVVNTSNFSNMY